MDVINGKKYQDLSERQKLFVLEYVKDFNGAQAVIRSGYSPKHPQVMAHKLLNNPVIKNEIAIRSRKKFSEIKIDSDILFQELAALATFDIAEVLDDDGNLLPIKEIPVKARKAISGLDINKTTDRNGDTHTTYKIKLAEKLKSIEILGKYLLEWTTNHKVEHQGKFTLESLLDETVKNIEAIDVTNESKSLK